MDPRATGELVRALGLQRLLAPDGRPAAGGASADALPARALAALYAAMVEQRAADLALTALVRTQRLAAYAPAFGLEGALLGATSALAPDDWLLPTPGPLGVARMRGATLEAGLARAFAGTLVRPGRVLAPTAPGGAGPAPGAHLLHAAGLARAIALEKGNSAVALAFVGAAAAESAELSSALGLAARGELPLVLVALEDVVAHGSRRVPSPSERAHALRVPVARVDGGDAAAVRAAAHEAVQSAREGLGPTLLEVFCWGRQDLDGGDVVAGWEAWDPLTRLGRWLEEQGVLAERAAAAARAAFEAELNALIAVMEVQGPRAPGSIVDGVFAATPRHLSEQGPLAVNPTGSR